MSGKFPQGCRSDFDEHKWIIQVRQQIEEDEIEEDDSSTPVCIFKVPKTLSFYIPDLHTPQQVSIGPYHYLHDGLYEMDRYKLCAAKRARKKLKCSKFEDLVEQLVKLDLRIRACYNNFLDLKSETLAWMMAVDACFMLEFMEIYDSQKGKASDDGFSKMVGLVDSRKQKLPHNIILQDLVMLENQIPLLVLRKVLEFQQPLHEVEENLVSMMMNVCKEFSPLSLMGNLSTLSGSFHLLDFLYQAIITTSDDNGAIVQVQEVADFIHVLETDRDPIRHSSAAMKISFWACKVTSILQEYVMALTRKVMVSRLTTVMTRLSWKIISNLPVVSMVKQPIELFISTVGNDQTNQSIQNFTSNIEKALLIEEITIPSVSELMASGVSFLPTNGGIYTIDFDAMRKILYLPKINIDVHTEVVLRNLISYEVLVISGPMVFTRYTELMNGIIDTEEDVRLLRENGIILSYLKSDSEVSSMWNGMQKVTRPTKVALFDKVIEDVNKYYDGRWQVKVKHFINFFVLDPWKFLCCLGVIFFSLFIMIQILFLIYKLAQLYGAHIT